MLTGVYYSTYGGGGFRHLNPVRPSGAPSIDVPFPSILFPTPKKGRSGYRLDPSFHPRRLWILALADSRLEDW